MKKLILILLLAIGLNAQVYDLLGTAQRIKDLDVRPSWVSFDGVDDYYSVADNDNLDFVGNVPFSIAIYFNSETNNNGYIEKGLGANNAYKLEVQTNTLYFFLFTDVNNQIRFSIDWTNYINQDIHLTITWSGDKTDTDKGFTLYVNGSPKTITASEVGAFAGITGNNDPLYLGKTSSRFTDGKVYGYQLYNRALTASEVVSLYNYGHPELYSLPYADRGASNTSIVTGEDAVFNSTVGNWTAQNSTTLSSSAVQQVDGTNSMSITLSSGIITIGNNLARLANVPFIVGKSYLVTCDYYNASTPTSYRFTVGGGNNVYLDGAKNQWNSVSAVITATATGNMDIRPFAGDFVSGDTLYIDNLSITQIGAVAEFYPENATSYSWIDASGNNLHAQGSGSPTAVRNPLEDGTIKQFKGSIAANTNTTLTGIVPKGYRIRAIRAVGSDSLTAVKIGTSSGGEEVVASTTTIGTTPKLLTLASTSNDAYSESADVTLYARHDTGASGKTMNLIFILEKVNK